MASETTKIRNLPRTSPSVGRRGLRPPVSAKRRWKILFASLFLTLEILLALGLVASVVVFWRFTKELPAIEGIVTDIRPLVATTIWSQDGVKLGELRVENRQPALLNEISEAMRDATIAIEDHRFYQHPGIDVQGIARAAWANLSSGSSQGASTLTQQLLRNLPQLGVGKEKRFERKVREAFLALRLEQLYSKDDILQLYLNNVYYGAGAYGVQAAAKTYFGKPAANLSISEASLLAGIVQNPTRFSLYTKRRNALERREEVLQRMLDTGSITQSQFRTAKAEQPKVLPRQTKKGMDYKAPHFVTYVLRQLTEKYGPDFLYAGLKIETSLNYKMQLMAEATLKNGLDRGAGFGANQGAMICLDNQTGYIRAMVGGRNFYSDQYNAVTQGRRQPGSTFKIFDYITAFEKGDTSLYSTFRDEPITYPNNPSKIVKNYGGGYSYAYLSCYSAIMHSTNTIAVAVAKKVGIKNVIGTASKMGITTPLAPYLPTALGASAVRPLDLASAYSVIPNKGRRCLPMSIIRVTDPDGEIVQENVPQITAQILKPNTVEQIDKALEGVVQSGTGTRARGYSDVGVVEGARGKTGTTNDNRDAWFAGYTPDLTTVIWVANVRRTAKGKAVYDTMPGATGGQLCAPMWHNFMITAIPEHLRTRANVLAVTVSPSQADANTTQERSSEEKETRRRRRRRATKPATVQTPTADPAAEDAIRDKGNEEEGGNPSPTPEPSPNNDPKTEEERDLPPPKPRPNDEEPAPAVPDPDVFL